MLRGNFNEVGGRSVHQDDLRILQEELLKAIQLQYNGLGAFVLQGCSVTGLAGNFSISAGLVFINNRVMEFQGANSIASFPVFLIQAADTLVDSFPLEQGGSAFKRTLIRAEISASAPGSGEFISMTQSGGRNYNDVLSNQFVRLQGSQTVNGQKSFTSSVISNGINVNNEFTNLNNAISSRVPLTRTITGNDGLAGGGDLSANRTINIANNGVTTPKLADGSVSLAKLAPEVREHIPTGIIVMWSGSANAIPAGWALCNGQNNTPDLRGRFIVGFDSNDFDYNAVGKTGGQRTVTLSVDQMPAHNHSVRYRMNGSDGTANVQVLNNNGVQDGANEGHPTGTNSVALNSAGGNQAHENRPPYFVLAYLMKV